MEKKYFSTSFPTPVYISVPVRSPIGKFGGSLRKLSAPLLAGRTLQEGLRRFSTIGNDKIDCVILGLARQAGSGPNPARQAAMIAGVPDTVPALTINQACASGMSAIIAGVEKIMTGSCAHVWVGGAESMSNTPYFLMQARWGHRLGHAQILDGMLQDGFFCPMAKMLMGETVEKNLVPRYLISRKEQDAFALQSQLKAETAWKSGSFQDETFLLEDLREDEHRRGQTTLVSLESLSPVFDAKAGTITAGNSSGITDGAAFMLLSQNRYPASYAQVLDYETIALEPELMGLGPVRAVRNILARQKIDIMDIEYFELNEAFAAQVIACQRELKIPPEKLNPKGGAIAIGHPIGATGARIVVSLAHTLVQKPGALGIATLCVSGGQGMAILIQSLDRNLAKS